MANDVGIFYHGVGETFQEALENLKMVLRAEFGDEVDVEKYTPSPKKKFRIPWSRRYGDKLVTKKRKERWRFVYSHPSKGKRYYPITFRQNLQNYLCLAQTYYYRY